MQKRFIGGILGLFLFEVLNVYFIMPLPGSQRVRSIDVAYAFHTWRWLARGVFGVLTVAGVGAVWRLTDWRRWLAPVSLLAVGAVIYILNYRMTADHMFRQPTVLSLQPI